MHTMFRMKLLWYKDKNSKKKCMQLVQIDVNCCKCEFPAEGLVLKIERYSQSLTQGYNIPHTGGTPVAQMVEHRAVTREVVSSTPAGPTFRVFK